MGPGVQQHADGNAVCDRIQVDLAGARTGRVTSDLKWKRERVRHRLMMPAEPTSCTDQALYWRVDGTDVRLTVSIPRTARNRGCVPVWLDGATEGGQLRSTRHLAGMVAKSRVETSLQAFWSRHQGAPRQ
jgi:hypothetical protein